MAVDLAAQFPVEESALLSDGCHADPGIDAWSKDLGGNQATVYK